MTGKKLQRHGHRIQPRQEHLTGQMVVPAPGDLMAQTIDPHQNDRCRAVMGIPCTAVEADEQGILAGAVEEPAGTCR